MISTYLGYATATKDITTTLNRVAAQPQSKRAIDYYNANIGKVTDIDDFMGDYKLYSYAMEAYGLSDMTYAKAMMKKVLTSDLSDPDSFANRLTDPRYKQIAAAFNFGTATTPSAQTSTSLTEMFGSDSSSSSSTSDDDSIGLYQQSFTDEETSAQTESDYYSSTIGTITNVNQFLGNDRLTDYVLKAYGIDPTYISKSFLKSMLTSDINDPNSFVNQNGSDADKAIVAQFNFNADGSVSGLTAGQQAEAAAAKTESDYYSTTIDTVTNVDDLIGDSRLKNYVLKAYGVDPASVSDADLKSMLTSDINDPNSFVNQNGSDAEKAMAAQFGFNADGTVSGAHAQTADQKTNVVNEYNVTVPSYTTDAGATALDAYYKSHIGSVTSVDDLVSDPRLFNYVKAAYGIDPSISTADFVAAAKDPRVAASKGLSSVFSQFNFQTDSADNDTYYQSRIGSIQSVDALAADSRMFAYVKTALGIDPAMTANEFAAAARDPALAATDNLTSVFAQFNFQADGTVATGQQAQTAAQIASTSQAYMTNAPAGGTVPTGALAQTTAQMATTSQNYMTDYQAQVQSAAQKANVISAYNATVPSFLTKAGAQDNDAYFKAHIGSITSVDQLTDDPRMFAYLKVALNMDKAERPGTSDAVYKFDLETALTDPSYASIMQHLGMTNVTSLFNFQADGTVAPGGLAQTSDQIFTLSKSYLNNAVIDQTNFVDDAVKNYDTRMESVKNINDFLASNATADSDSSNDDLPELYQMALRSFGIGSDEVSKTEVRKILESDPYDPKSYVNSIKGDDGKQDVRFANFAKAFNFDAKGNFRQPVQALSQTQVSTYVSEYSSRTTAGLTGATKTKASSDAKDAATYFAKTIVTVKNLSDFLADSKLVNFVLTANGIDPKSVDSDTLKKAFTSDPDDSKSFINTPDGAKFKSIVAAFNFDPQGNMIDTKLGIAQNKGALDQLNDNYLHQTLEDQQGETSPGVRLALYFERKAPDINSVYDIMGDAALYQVITTTFSLPSSISAMDVDDQAKLLQKDINIDDLHDPTKLNKLLQRFSVMYDLANNNTAASSPAVSILSGSAANGISADTLLSIAQLKAR